MNIRRWVMAAYCVVLLAGTWWIIDRNNLAPVDFVATRDLPVNRLLRPDDVVRQVWVNGVLQADRTSAKEFVGRYTRLAVPKGALLRLWSTDAVPHIVPRTGFQTVAAILPRDKLGDINAESCVRLTATDNKSVAIRTVMCPTAEKADCAALIDIAIERMPGIATETAPLAVDAKVDCH